MEEVIKRAQSLTLWGADGNGPPEIDDDEITYAEKIGGRRRNENANAKMILLFHHSVSLLRLLLLRLGCYFSSLSLLFASCFFSSSDPLFSFFLFSSSLLCFTSLHFSSFFFSRLLFSSLLLCFSFLLFLLLYPSSLFSLHLLVFLSSLLFAFPSFSFLFFSSHFCSSVFLPRRLLWNGVSGCVPRKGSCGEEALQTERRSENLRGL